MCTRPFRTTPIKNCAVAFASWGTVFWLATVFCLRRFAVGVGTPTGSAELSAGMTSFCERVLKHDGQPAGAEDATGLAERGRRNAVKHVGHSTFAALQGRLEVCKAGLLAFSDACSSGCCCSGCKLIISMNFLSRAQSLAQRRLRSEPDLRNRRPILDKWIWEHRGHFLY